MLAKTKQVRGDFSDSSDQSLATTCSSFCSLPDLELEADINAMRSLLPERKLINSKKLLKVVTETSLKTTISTVDKYVNVTQTTRNVLRMKGGSDLISRRLLRDLVKDIMAIRKGNYQVIEDHSSYN